MWCASSSDSWYNGHGALADPSELGETFSISTLNVSSEGRRPGFVPRGRTVATRNQSLVSNAQDVNSLYGLE